MTIRGSLDRSGLASLEDLVTPHYLEIFARLEADAALFELQAKTFRSTEYHWPADPLHQWSRVWEYPYVWHHLDQLLATQKVHVMDLGSGVTFFPFALATRGAHVTCIDIDPVAGRDLTRAIESIHPSPGGVEFLKTDGVKLNLPDNALDAAYCISVLEHVPEPASLVPEIARVIKPGGMFLLTIDVAVEGARAEIQPEQYLRLREALEREFEYIYPEDTVHPQRVIATDNSPYPLQTNSSARLKNLLRRIVNKTGRGKIHIGQFFRLWCHGFVLRRRMPTR